MSIGGLNIFGIVVTAGYLFVALLAWAASVSFFRVRPAGRAAEQARARAFAWLLVGLILLALGIAKIYRVEPMITEHFRAAAKKAGEYQDRRDEQRIDVILVLALALPLAAGLLALLRHAGERALIAVAMALLLIAFIGVRMVSFHDIDGALALGFDGFTVSNAIELGGQIGIAIAAASRPSSSWISQSAASHRGRRRSR